MANEFDGDALRKRLDAIILLLLENFPGGADSTNKKIERVRELGFANAEVAQVIRKKLNYVTTVVSRSKKSSRKKKVAAS